MGKALARVCAHIKNDSNPPKGLGSFLYCPDETRTETARSPMKRSGIGAVEWRLMERDRNECAARNEIRESDRVPSWAH